MSALHAVAHQRVGAGTVISKSAEDVEGLIDELREMLGPAWARVVVWLRDNNAVGVVEERIRRGDFEGALGGLVDAASWFASEVGASEKYAARHASARLSQALDTLIDFDESNARAVRAFQSTRVRLVGDVSREQRDAIRTVITDGITRGDNPRAIARDVRWSIGLTDYQSNIVLNFRRELESGQWAKASSRELIDGRWIRTFDRLRRDGGRLTDAQITAMVNKYSDNWVAFRSEVISRTEGLRAAHAGSHNAYEQAIQNGRLLPDELERTWRHGPVRRHSRDGHVKMNGQRRPWGVPFDNPLTGAQLMYPCDPNAPIRETAQCTCVEVVRIRRRN